MISLAGTLIEIAAAVVISFHAGWAFLDILRGRGADRARILIADGVLSGLGFSVAGTLLKAIGLASWSQMGMFAFVFALRTMLKHVFAWERGLIEVRTR